MGETAVALIEHEQSRRVAAHRHRMLERRVDEAEGVAERLRECHETGAAVDRGIGVEHVELLVHRVGRLGEEEIDDPVVAGSGVEALVLAVPGRQLPVRASAEPAGISQYVSKPRK